MNTGDDLHDRGDGADASAHGFARRSDGAGRRGRGVPDDWQAWKAAGLLLSLAIASTASGQGAECARSADDLLLWHEIADEDAGTTPHRQLGPPSIPTVVTLRPDEFAEAEFFQPNGEPMAMRREDRPERIRLEVPDEILVIKLIPTAKR